MESPLYVVSAIPDKITSNDHLYSCDQFFGFAGSSGPSRSTSLDRGLGLRFPGFLLKSQLVSWSEMPSYDAYPRREHGVSNRRGHLKRPSKEWGIIRLYRRPRDFRRSLEERNNIVMVKARLEHAYPPSSADGEHNYKQPGSRCKHVYDNRRSNGTLASE